MTRKPTFGQAVTTLRRQRGLTQKELAAKICREQTGPISPQYLNDIEHDRRKPSGGELILAVAAALDVDPSFLAFSAGQLPPEISELSLDEGSLRRAIEAFRRVAAEI